MRRVWELVGDGRIYQFGIRSGTREEFQWAREHVFTQRFTLDGFTDIRSKLGSTPVYCSIDLDVLDPSVFPGTGTPEAGGVDFLTLLGAILQLSDLHIVGMDVNELAPSYDASGASTAVALKVLRELLLAVSKS
jgi:agmatinase